MKTNRFSNKVFGCNTNQTKFNSVTNNRNLDEDDEVSTGQQFCGYFLEQRPITKLVVPIDTDFKDAAHYRMVVNKILELSELDCVEFHINSPGGDLSGLVALLHGINATEAETVAVIQGECHSAASILALSCDSVQVGPFANMLCHSIRYGLTGKGADIRSQVNHTNAYAEMIFRNAYEYFLSEEEINDVLDGKELWLDFDEINERLTHKYSLLQEQQDASFGQGALHEAMQAGCCGDPEGCDDICACPFAEDCDD
jgi:ATP-dependent protease ClpP protease subunit